MDFSGLSEHEKVKFLQLMEKKQQEDSIRLYYHVVELCFDHCINDFTSKVFSSREETCLSRCVDKFIRHSARVGVRFNENQQQLMQQNQPQQ